MSAERVETERSVWTLARQEPWTVALLVMAVVGVAIGAYLTTVHYAKVPPVCTTSNLVNCARVTSSAYSLVPGTQIPITIPGMLWFIVSGALAGVALRSVWTGTPEPPRLRLAHFLWSAAGLVFVLYLVYAEIVLLRSICEWCTVVHILTLATFLITLSRLQSASVEPDFDTISRASARQHASAHHGGMPARTHRQRARSHSTAQDRR